MIENRKYHRIELSAQATVRYQNVDYEGVLGSISLEGAAITFNESAMIPHGDDCSISIFLDETLPPVQLHARVTNSSLYRIGIAFTNMTEEQKNGLFDLLMNLTQLPEPLHNGKSLFIALSR